MKQKLLSVITVCYNAEDSIEMTMRSVLMQNVDGLEYIIVDGASDDKTVPIALRVSKSYPNSDIKIISEPDGGIYDAMNKGLAMATGEWLNFMNAGDTFTDCTVLRRICDSGLMSEGSVIYSDFIADNGKKRRLVNQEMKKGKILHQSTVYKKALHEKYGLYYVTHPYIVSDYFFFLQIPEKEFVKFPSPISVNDVRGISMQGHWMEYGRICADYMMHRTTEVNFVFGVFTRFVINTIRYILHCR